MTTHVRSCIYIYFSALYVIDLKRFRKIAAGDRLRGQYQGLSQDPNSLSNLDQDLPNNMIHQVAIKSLPQEWLWCETWCSDESKKYAKTIDLVSKRPDHENKKWKQSCADLSSLFLGFNVFTQVLSCHFCSLSLCLKKKQYSQHINQERPLSNLGCTIFTLWKLLIYLLTIIPCYPTIPSIV